LLFSGCLEQPNKGRYGPGNVRCQAGRREVEPEQDADQRMHNAQAGIPDQDEHHGGQNEQHRQGYGQEITSSPLPATGKRQGSYETVAETATRLTTRPAATCNALHAGQRAVLGQRATRTRLALTAAGQH